VDVTSYPDVNDLILAADVAVLDYSSMRFDFALTGRPRVFLVPDLDDYGSRTRGFLWDFGETAPGPWVRYTAEVVAELRDLDALSRRWAEPLAAFNARYNQLQDGHAAERVVAEFFSDL
jgi:CDP-glycerol glycerophosphotransferase